MCQTLGTAVHVNVFVVLTRIDHCLMTLSCLPCACLCKVHSLISDTLSQALCNLSLAFLDDFTLSNSTAFIRFIAFSRKLYFAFCLDRMITAFTCLPSTGTAALHCRHTFVGGILMYCQWPIIKLAMNASPKNKTAASQMVQIHTHAHFRRS